MIDYGDRGDFNDGDIFIDAGLPERFASRTRYLILAITGSVTILFSILLCAFGTLNQLPYLHKVKSMEKFTFSNFGN